MNSAYCLQFTILGIINQYKQKLCKNELHVDVVKKYYKHLPKLGTFFDTLKHRLWSAVFRT